MIHAWCNHSSASSSSAPGLLCVGPRPPLWVILMGFAFIIGEILSGKSNGIPVDFLIALYHSHHSLTHWPPPPPAVSQSVSQWVPSCTLWIIRRRHILTGNYLITLRIAPEKCKCILGRRRSNDGFRPRDVISRLVFGQSVSQVDSLSHSLMNCRWLSHFFPVTTTIYEWKLDLDYDGQLNDWVVKKM